MAISFAPPQDHPDRRFDQLEVEGPAFADDDIVRVMVDHGVPVVVKRRQKATFADHEGSPVRLLLGKVPRGRHRAGVDVLFIHVDSHAGELRRHVAPRALAVVRQEAEGDVAATELRDKAVGAVNQLRAAVENPIHIDEEAVFHNSSSRPCPSGAGLTEGVCSPSWRYAARQIGHTLDSVWNCTLHAAAKPAVSLARRNSWPGQGISGRDPASMLSKSRSGCWNSGHPS